MSTSTRLKVVKHEVSDDVLLSLALELEREEEETLQRLCIAVLSDDHVTAKKLAKELKA